MKNTIFFYCLIMSMIAIMWLLLLLHPLIISVIINDKIFLVLYLLILPEILAMKVVTKTIKDLLF